MLAWVELDLVVCGQVIFAGRRPASACPATGRVCLLEFGLGQAELRALARALARA